MESPNISILLPTYEPNETFLRAAIDGVLHQSTPHWTLTIRDDASSNDVEAMIRPYLKDTRIRFVRNESRQGIAGNWNRCLHDAQGQFVQYLFQDDLWYRTYLEENITVFEGKKHVGIVASRHAYKAEDDEESAAFFQRGPFATVREFWERDLTAPTHSGRRLLLWWLRQGLRPNVVGEPSFVMLRREVCEELGPFRTDMPQGLDLEYWIRALRVTDIHFINRELGLFRVHRDSASMANDRAGEGLLDRLRCYEILLRTTQGELHGAATTALTEQMGIFWRKFRRRVHAGKTVRMGNSWLVLGLFLRHPRLMFRSLAALRQEENSASLPNRLEK
jgi:glycosyltransferase involved in cell wall biosynthesis